eukprot:CAMPEP_0182942148 /NCGR_PEP_ID=MMETSP0105_2-20130417/50140_1 /TAXON_ID=81532 ORGANISM="Acanthoeca-like sp., Strain 10tr" /NCGR_SAMPLE_ID=MMETSP0105_2 /ASSEMBLY_ACC=CAM_ASM_000205 /LENGTH=667 /DNA_ID=CAMNT_0025081847 /DNA_START=64 /DNA_END=2067 /DNA_ORIENTATION=+
MGRRKSTSSAKDLAVSPGPPSATSKNSTFPRAARSKGAKGAATPGMGRGRGRGRGINGASPTNASTKAIARGIGNGTLERGRRASTGRGRGVNGAVASGGPSRAGGGMQRKGSIYARKKQSFLGSEDISRAKWYLGLTNRLECDKAVLAAGSGDFLVRMSSKKDKYVVVVNDAGKPQNFLCHIVTGTSKVKMGGVEFESIMSALQYLKVNPLHSRTGGMYVLGDPACDKEWYVGLMDRDQCEKMVLAAGKCDYLVRLASDLKNYAIVINQGDGSCKHCKIFADINSFTLSSKTAKTMTDLLEQIKSVPIYGNDGKSMLYLRKPAARAAYYVGNMPRSEAEAYVMKSADGDYLIRQNTKGDKYVLVVNGGAGNVKNFIISAQADGKFSFGGLPHESLEMVIRFLRKTPLMGHNNKPMYINKPALLTDAEDMIADASFSFGEAFESPAPSFQRKSSFSGGMPMFDSDDDDEVEAYTGAAAADDDEVYDVAVKPGESIDPFRAECVKPVTGLCKVGDAVFVVAKANGKYRAVFKGQQIEVPMDAVEEVRERRASASAAAPDDDDDDADDADDDFGEDDDFGGFDEAEEELARREAELQARNAEDIERIKQESEARIAALDASQLDVDTEEEKAEKQRLEEEARKLEEELAALQEDIDGFGEDGEDDEDDL